MRRSVLLKRRLSGLLAMAAGSIMVLGMVVLTNRFADGIDRSAVNDAEQIVFERKPPPKKNTLQPPKPKPKPKRAPRTPPPPLAGLAGNLSGVDFGLPGFDLSDLDGMDSDLLGGAGGIVMTDDTVDEPPRATFQAPMQFPPRARAQGVTGYVVLSLLIGVTGQIEEIRVVESYPDGVFDDVAVQGVRQWKFEPANYQGKAVRSWAKQRVRFDLS